MTIKDIAKKHRVAASDLYFEAEKIGFEGSISSLLSPEIEKHLKAYALTLEKFPRTFIDISWVFGPIFGPISVSFWLGSNCLLTYGYWCDRQLWFLYEQWDREHRRLMREYREQREQGFTDWEDKTWEKIAGID